MGQDLWLFEKKSIDNGFSRIAGIDEAGRGPLAGPVVSAAVILPIYLHIPGISDSKKLTPKKRAYFYDKIYDRAVSVGIGIVDPPEIDRINILQAALLSMAMASENLSPQPDCLLIDGIFRIFSTLPQEPIPKGDARSISIAAASIIAKVTRDRLMEGTTRITLSLDFPNTKDTRPRPIRQRSGNSDAVPSTDKALRELRNICNPLRQHLKYSALNL